MTEDPAKIYREMPLKSKEEYLGGSVLKLSKRGGAQSSLVGMGSVTEGPLFYHPSRESLEKKRMDEVSRKKADKKLRGSC